MLKNYKQLLIDLEIHQGLRDSFEANKNYYLKLYNTKPKDLTGINYDGMPKGSRNDMTLDRILNNIWHYDSLIEVETNIIDTLQANIKRINELIKDSDNIYNKVAYLKYQKDEYGRKKYTLEQIAEMLVYSVQRIKQISQEV